MSLDFLVHMVVAAAMTVSLYFTPHFVAVPLAVVVYWYGWELGQRIAKDPEKRGFAHWWHLVHWSWTARIEFMAPAAVAIIGGVLLGVFL